MSIVTIWGVLIIAAFLSVMLKPHRPELALGLALAAGVGVLALVLTQVTPALTRIQSMLESASVSGEYVLVLFKALGVCLLTQIAADVCRDAGEAGLAAKAELAGKAIMLLLALPLFEKIGELALTLINGEVGG